MPTTVELDGIVRRLVKAMVAGHDDLPTGAWEQRLRGLARLETFTRGDVLVEHHAVADDLHFLVDGSVRYEHLVTDDGGGETVSARRVPWMPVGWSSLHLRRYRVTAVAATDGRTVSLPIARFDALSRNDPPLWAHLSEFVFRTATRMLWVARGHGQQAPTPAPAKRTDLSLSPAVEPGELDVMFQQSTSFSALPGACRRLLAAHSVVYRAAGGTRIIEVGAAAEGLWLLLRGRVALSAVTVGGGQGRTSVHHVVRPGTLLCWSAGAVPLPAPFGVDATRDTTVAFVPRSTLTDLLRRHSAWGGAVFRRQLWQLRGFLLATRTGHGGQDDDGGVGVLADLIEDSKPVLPVNSELYGVPYLLRNRLTRRDGFDRLHRTHFDGTDSEREVATLSLDLLRDLERAQRWFAGLQATYAVVAANRHLEAAALRKLASRYFRDALAHIPYVIKGWEHLPDDPGCIVIYNHMAYADESILPNGFLFNPDSHFVSSIVLEARYGDGIRVSRANARTEFWRADYYERLGHISVATPESGWRDETPEEKQQRTDSFFADCAAVLAGGRPFAIAPEGTITEEQSVTGRSPGPMKAGAFLMSGRFPGHPKIVPVALANFDEPPHRAVFGCVIKPPFTMESRGVDVDDRHALGRFLTSYRREFRSHVEEAVDVARSVTSPGTDTTGLVTNVDRVDAVGAEFEHDVRALEHKAQRVGGSVGGSGATVFYGSSTIRQWTSLQADLGLPGAVNLGFGGSTLEACRIYFDRLVLPHRPARLIVYGGDNDIARGASPEFVSDQFRELADKVRTHLPAVRCWFVSVKPSPARRGLLSSIEQANALVADEISRRGRWRYVDWFRCMLDDEGQPDARLFEPDLLHVNAAGYGVLANLLRRHLDAD